VSFAEDALTRDGFLGGRVFVRQPRRGFRSSVDAVLMAATVPARPGQSVLELGCGAGAAMLCLGTRVAGLRLAGLELQADYAALARRNAAEAGIGAEVHQGDLARMPAALRAERFDHVMANPPYFPPGGGTAARDGGRETALREGETPLADWVRAGLRRLADGGVLTVIQAADRLPALLAALPGEGRGVTALALHPRAGRPASRVILRVVKGGRAAFRMAAPFVLHAGDQHLKDGDDYAAQAAAILRDAAALEF
jgi:tRNA1(Val) A37 N6-methylase TrmN6